MRSLKFKVGDKVKVLRASTDEEHDLWGDSWMPKMDKSIGYIFTIEYRCTYENREYPKYLLSNNDGMNYPEFVLQKEAVVGQQLLFDFMNEVT